jgi:hypothetical protein
MFKVLILTHILFSKGGIMIVESIREENCFGFPYLKQNIKFIIEISSHLIPSHMSVHVSLPKTFCPQSTISVCSKALINQPTICHWPCVHLHLARFCNSYWVFPYVTCLVLSQINYYMNLVAELWGRRACRRRSWQRHKHLPRHFLKLRGLTPVMQKTAPLAYPKYSGKFENSRFKVSISSLSFPNLYCGFIFENSTLNSSLLFWSLNLGS